MSGPKVVARVAMAAAVLFFFFFIICLCVARPPFWSIEKSFFWRGGNAKRETQKEQVMQEDKQVAANGQDDGF